MPDITAPLADPVFCPLGIDGVLVRFARDLTPAANASASAFCAQIRSADLSGVTEVASSLTSVRVGFDPGLTDRQAVTDQLRDMLRDLQSIDTSPRRLWHIPVAFGPAHAPQLKEAAALAGLTPDQAVQEITATRLRVLAIGFAPGQPYLGLMPAHWDIPRQPDLTPKVPRGALVTAVRQLIIFAADTPTGWRQIGQSAFSVWRPDSDTPFPLDAGDAVQFSAVSDDTLRDLQANADSNGGARCEVLR
ncbi:MULTISPECIES: 5-oxoprolinase subunit B family protein [unclassified Yoonia]|uniref:5-oxoprolinase subunit B family protein n=1 Tax=unclassified Yoonia TaxID=2629118 RepID=UPI002AFF8018|nr:MULTISPECIES: carboxyltransferase domain-containing protein [unclassified Yoonia]